MRTRRDITVVKLGGSFAYAPELENWIDAMGRCGGRVLLVPGGGPFAETVHHAQMRIGFDDDAAHHMALLAMEQFGRALVGRNRRMMLAASAAAIDRALREDKVPVWAPAQMVLAADDIPADWEVTSDSLAAWLAGAIAAPRLLLVKWNKFDGDRVTVMRLVGDGTTDMVFPQFLAGSGTEAALAGPNDHAAAAAALRDGNLFGTRIVVDTVS